jgi:hypothetical protein
LLLGGCDLAFGVGGDPNPCELASFDGARSTEISPAIRFSVDWDQRFAVVVIGDGYLAEIALADGTKTLIDLGPYEPVNLSLNPEGNALLYTARIEPPVLAGALRASVGTWQLDARAPTATFTGTPSADVFGPRRMLARMHEFDVDDQGQPTVQELEDDNGTWVRVGSAHPLVADLPPNLTPNGLTAVFSRSATTEMGTVIEIFGMTRPSTDVWFGEPVKILSNGSDHSPQLLGHCERLYTIHGGGEGGPALTRYER